MSAGLAPSADDVARAIVAAARETGGDLAEVALGVASGQMDRRRGRRADAGGAPPYPIFRARAYAAKALAKVFTSHWRTRIAGYVGAQGLSRQSYFSSLDQRIASPAGKPWWDEAILARVVAAISDGVPRAVSTGTPFSPSGVKPSTPLAVPASKAPERERSTPSERMQALAPRPFKAGPLPMHDPRKLGPTTEASATRLKRVLGDLGPPRRSAVEEGLDRRAREGRECRDLLAEAARNTAALPIPKAEGDD